MWGLQGGIFSKWPLLRDWLGFGLVVGGDPLYHLDLVGFYPSFTYQGVFILTYDFFSHLLSPCYRSEQAGGGCLGGSQGNTPHRVMQKNYLLTSKSLAV